MVTNLPLQDMPCITFRGCTISRLRPRIPFRRFCHSAFAACARTRVLRSSDTSHANASTSTIGCQIMSIRLHAGLPRYPPAMQTRIAPAAAARMCISLHAALAVHRLKTHPAAAAHARPPATGIQNEKAGTCAPLRNASTRIPYQGSPYRIAARATTIGRVGTPVR
jgi:hypothetical protein